MVVAATIIKATSNGKQIVTTMRIAITGITGYFGGHIAATLAQHGHTVTGIVRPTSRLDHLRDRPLSIRVATLDGQPELCDAFRGADVIIHSAAKVHSLGPWREFDESIIAATRHTLNAAIAAGVPRFIQMSTVGVYGFPCSSTASPFAETCPHGPIHRWNYYSRAKAAAENLVLAAQQSGRLAATILRPTWMYGPHDTTVMERIVTALRRGRFPWIGTATNRLSLVNLSDALDAVVRVVEQPAAGGRIYNIAADELSPTQREFITRLCELLNLPLPAHHIPYRLAQFSGFAGECLAHATAFRIRPPLTRLTVHLFGGLRQFRSDRLRQELGWRPQTAFAEGIIRATDWLRPPVP